METHAAGRDGMTHWLLSAATAGLAHWFFGNLYEAIIISPNAMATIERGESPGSVLFPRIAPTWYYTPLNALTPLALGAALIVERSDTERRRWLRRAMGGTLAGVALTAVAVTQVNLKLYVGNHRETDPGRMRALQRLWDKVNTARLVCVGVALIATVRAMKPASVPAPTGR